MRKLLSILFFWPIMLFGQSNPGYNSFVGDNGITVNVFGAGNSKKVHIGGSSGVTNGFLSGTTGQLGKFLGTNIVGNSGLTIGASTNISGFGGTTDIVSVASHNITLNGIPIGGITSYVSNLFVTNLTVHNESIFEGDTTFEGVNDFSGTLNIFNGPVYFNSNFVFNGVLITNIAQVNSAPFIPVSTGSNFINSQFWISGGKTYLTNTGNSLEAQLYLMRSNDASSLVRVGSRPAGGELVSSGGLILQSAQNASISLGEGTNGLYFLTQNFYPSVSNKVTLGTALLPFSQLYVGTGSIHFIGPGIDSDLTADATTLYLNGIPVGGGDNLWRFDTGSGYLLSDSITTNSDFSLFLGGSTLVFTNGPSSFQLFNSADGISTLQGGVSFLFDSPKFVVTNASAVDMKVYGNASFAGSLMDGPDTLSYYGPLHGNEALVSYSLGDNTKFLGIGSATSPLGEVFSSIELATQTNNADLQINSFPDGVNANRIHINATDAAAAIEGYQAGAIAFSLNTTNGTLRLSGQTNLIGMNGSGQVTLDSGGIKTPDMTTSDPGSGTDPWQLGKVITGASVALVTTNYVEVKIGATVRKLALVQ